MMILFQSTRFPMYVIGLLFSMVGVQAQQTWVPVWADEFDYTGLPDDRLWGYDVGGAGWGNQEAQYYTSEREENAYVEDGMLTITARKEAFEGSDYTSARLVTKGKGDWLYGRVEVRAKMPTGKGMWPAIWMLPTENVYGTWPASGEIDIMENVGFEPDVIHWNVHTQSYNHTIGTNKGSEDTFVAPYDNFYTYSIEWSPDSITYFVDDVAYFTFYNEKATFAEWPFDQKFHLILNIAIGGTWGGLQGIDDAVFPQEMLVDYVRVYKLADENATDFPLMYSVDGGGSIDANLNEGSVAKGTAVTLEAIPDPGSVFAGWSGTYSGLVNPLSFDIGLPTDVVALFAKEGNLLQNGTFAAGGSSWWHNDGGSSTVSYTGGDAQFSIVTTSTNVWDKQLLQTDIVLEAGHTYEFEFEAKGSSPTTINTLVGLNASPWTTYLNETVLLASSSQRFTFTFTMPVDDPAARVGFDLGNAQGTVNIDNISLVDLTLVGLGDENNLELVEVHPNPTQDLLLLNRKAGTVHLFDLKGTLWKSWFETKELALDDLPAGMYVLEIDGQKVRVTLQ